MKPKPSALNRTGLLAFLILFCSFTIYVMPDEGEYEKSSPEDLSVEAMFSNHQYEIAMIGTSAMLNFDYEVITLFDSIVVEIAQKCVAQADYLVTQGITSTEYVRLRSSTYNSLNLTLKAAYAERYAYAASNFNVHPKFAIQINRLYELLLAYAPSNIQTILAYINAYFTKAADLKYTYLEIAEDFTGTLDLENLAGINPSLIDYGTNLTANLSGFLFANDQLVPMHGENLGLGLLNAKDKLDEMEPAEFGGHRTVAPAGKEEYILYPNPTSTNSTLAIKINQNRNLAITVVNAFNGAVVQQLNKPVDKGYNNMAINLSAVPKGQYILNIYDKSTLIYSIKFQKL